MTEVGLQRIAEPEAAELRARIEDTYGWTRGMAFVWLSNGDKGYRITMPVDLARALVAALND